MKHTRVLTLLFVVAVAGFTRSAAAQEDPLIPGFAIVRMAGATTVDSFLTVLNQQYPTLNASVADTIPNRWIYLLQFTAPPPVTLNQLENSLEFTYVSQGYLSSGDLLYEGQAPEGQTGSTWLDSLVPSHSYNNQYAMTHMGVNAAQQRATGDGTVVAVLDTGVDHSHPALQGNIAAGGYNVIADSTMTADVGDNIDNDGDGQTDEMVGHGTYVAGLIALAAPGARILPVTVLNSDGIGDGWTFAKGMFYAIDRGVEVINLSLRSTYETQVVFDAIVEARQKGIIVVAAAGNLNHEEPRDYPAMDDDSGVFGVAALDDIDIKASFSNFNKRLFISASGDSTSSGPGNPNLARSIISTIPGGGYSVWEGTSMAVPFVSAAAALIRSQHPQWPANQTTYNNIRNRIAGTAVNIYGLNPQFAEDQELGVGRINIGAAVAQGPIAPPHGDLNADGLVNVADLLRVITDWGLVHTSSDLNGDGTVGVGDLLIVISAWG